jgi:disulfide bond formation protein DsbB
MTMFSKRMIWGMVVIVALALALAACGGGGSAPSGDGPAVTGPTERPPSVGDVAAGEEQFNSLCIACHGPGGVGVEGLGKPFTTSEFLLTVSDEELLEFVKVGRPISDPLNTTGVDMPPKGGNPALTDEQILDIIAYVRTLHE